MPCETMAHKASQLQGILDFVGCSARIKQSERLCQIKQGVNECSTVLEGTVNKTPSTEESSSLTEELSLIIAIISPFSLPASGDPSDPSVVAARRARVRNSWYVRFLPLFASIWITRSSGHPACWCRFQIASKALQLSGTLTGSGNGDLIYIGSWSSKVGAFKVVPHTWRKSDKLGLLGTRSERFGSAVAESQRDVGFWLGYGAANSI